MAVSLHDAVVKGYLQGLERVGHLVDKAEAHCTEHGLDATTLTEARLAEDMWPFAKQVFECGHHSARAIAGVRAGEFNPELDPVPSDFAALRGEVAEALRIVSAVAPDELDAIAGREMLFRFRDFRQEYTVADFLLSFSLPNFYFHATTAYAILRARGLALGKRDYLGKTRTVTARV
ncbi:DUF1993 domain-containing protein [Novosphingobium album (ex Liu et al. 2023)]|uniref:DUF1993 domain-containing protein n=1 Tax=Novosphingobium album (ex Liu et al. 2023) TaxID=3031130 RepID=A0ABT5WT54_9SPHN|nr:DUF1993 domain-containing protein [Novosphingobium album (ex Liu et al. 2023)]MDE8653051.1 DUF1993 domain-containing protein [Novosphingobium album (ex Liu et al. 2023)]